MGRRKPSHRLAAGVVACTLSLALPVSAAGSEAEADYGVRPAPIGDSTRSIDRFTHSLEPGTTITDALQIFNFSNEVLRFDVYSSDLVPSNTGSLAPAAREMEITGAGNWIRPATGSVEVGPRGSAQVSFDITVPEGVTPGQYGAAVLVEREGAIGSGAIQATARVGLLLELEVLGAVNIDAQIGDLVWARRDKSIVFGLPLTNTGNVTLSVTGDVEISTDDGEPFARLQLQPADRSVAPGEDAYLEVGWGDPPLLGRFEAVATVVATVENRAPVELSSQPVTIWLIPWGWIFGLLVLITLGVWALHRSRPWMTKRARHRREKKALLRDFRKRRSLEELTESERAGGRSLFSPQE